jgi:Flp pilus assembly protein TadD
MTDVLDLAPRIEAAQQAAAAGDYSEAKRVLREVARIQELSLGSLHPDLASTLNNLALVCERTNKFDEAERGYRRAQRDCGHLARPRASVRHY